MKVNYISEKLVFKVACLGIIIYCIFLLLNSNKFFNNDELEHYFDDQVIESPTEGLA